MVFKVRVVPNAGRRLVKEDPDGTLKIYLAKPALKGQANKELKSVLADYLKVKKSLISIFKGEKSKYKIVRVSQ